MKNLFKINVFTYLFFLLSILSGYYKDIFIIYLILFIHELGHYFLMKLNNIEVKSIVFYPYGGIIKSNMLINTNSYKILLISLGGIINQLILYIIGYLLFKINIIDLNIFNLFIKYNTLIIIFNLLPITPLDGYKIMNSIFELYLPFRISLLISIIINVITLLLFVIYLYIFKINNYIIIFFLLFSLINYLKSYKYILNKFYIERVIYNLKHNGLISIKDIKNIYKNKYNYINEVNEYDYLNNKIKYFY